MQKNAGSLATIETNGIGSERVKDTEMLFVFVHVKFSLYYAFILIQTLHK